MEEFVQNQVALNEADPSPKPDKRKKYIFKTGPVKTRAVAYSALIAGFLFLALLFIATSYAINAPITEIPLFEIALGEDEVEELEDVIDDLLDDLDTAIEIGGEEAIREIEAELGYSAEELQDIFENLSLFKMATVFADFDSEAGASAAMLLIGFICIIAAVVAILAAFAVGFMKKGLMIAAYIVSVLIHIFFAGAVFLILATVLCVAYFVLLTIANRSYKNYKIYLEDPQ